MKSYTKLRNLYGSLTNNTATANLTLGDQLINDGIFDIHGMPQDWWFLYTSKTDTTVADQQNYETPYNFKKMVAVTITVGSTVWPLNEVSSQKRWNDLNETTFTSDIPEYYFINKNEVEFWPTPASSSNTITYYYKKASRELQNADYTTGTVTLTNDSTTVTGSGTTFTAAMVGRWLKGDNDNRWYEIDTFSSTTSIALRVAFEAATASGLSYTIGEMPDLPEEYHKTPVYYAVAQYWYQNDDVTRGDRYMAMYERDVQKIVDDNYGRSADIVIGDTQAPINPNLFVTL